MKRIISIIAVVAMLLTFTAIFASCGSGQSVPNAVVNKAIDSSGKVTWSYDNNTYTLTIMGDKNNPVPMFNEKDPTSPDDIPWKSVRNYVYTVEIEGVTDVPDYAFYSMSALKAVKFRDNNVTSIGKCAFAYCRVLSLADVSKTDSSQPITLPEGITSIGDSAFEGCSSLTKITLPKSLVNSEKETVFGDRVFAYDYNLKEVVKSKDLTIPDTITTIDGTKKITLADLKEEPAAPESGETDTPDESGETETPTESESASESATESETTTDTEKKEETNNTTTIIAISIFAVVIVGIIIGGILLYRSNKKQTKDARTVRKNTDENKAENNAKNGKNAKKGKKK